MNMEFLQKLADAQLPLTLLKKGEIEILRELDAAGYVKAFIPPVHVDCDDCTRQGPAVVLEITARGRRLLSDSFARQVDASIPGASVKERRSDLDRGKGHLARLLGGALHSLR